MAARFGQNEKSVEQLEEERIARSLSKKDQQKAPVQSTVKPVAKPQEPNPPQQQPKKVWKYQQKQAETKNIYTGPPMDLSTRVGYLNSLYDQGSIDDKEYAARSADLQTIASIVNAVCDGNLEQLQPLLEEHGHLIPLIYENESNIIHLAVEAVLTKKAPAALLKTILEHRSVDVNSVRKGDTPLLSLCKRCRSSNTEEAIKTLVSFGADVNKGGVIKEGSKIAPTPLAAALVNQVNVSLIRFLCENGADPNTNTEDGPVLNWAIINGKDEEAKIFIERGANPNSREFQQGATCLASAVFEGKIELVKLLLKHGADKNAPIMRSQQATAKELVKQLKSGNPDIAAIEPLL